MSEEKCVIERTSVDTTLEIGDKIDPTKQYDYGVRHEITGFNPDEGTITFIDGHVDEEVTKPYWYLTTSIKFSTESKDYVRS